ncbi:putative fructose-bisphosphate aldolase protein [Rosellinia necatrix]|uniref:Putative fructose-bisphosphate aldolase protein n=1 Tax=Rosellinia necatrix TaxID=77044 RepID=A0A1W2TPF7_ROSNE|nr:putative fructose-bisphosphate aldolase protein [Rosellinia necatrix]
MATPGLTRSAPTCLSCLRRLTQQQQQQQPSALSPLSWIQARTKTTKAELEDLQGLPVRLLRDMPGYGRKHAIIRVKGGRMRNIWFPKGAAEYMTRVRFAELGLTEAAIGVRDRTFGTRLVLDEEQDGTKSDSKKKERRKEVLTMPAEETLTLLEELLPHALVFARRPVVTTPPPPPQPRSPSLAANAATSVDAPEFPGGGGAGAVTPIFGSVSRGDILAMIKDQLAANPQGSRITLEADSLELLGLDPEHDGENRIKRLGTFEVRISPGPGPDGSNLGPVSRKVEVVPGEL